MSIKVLVAFFLILTGCVGVKAYEKEYLLHPLMDEGALQSLNSEFSGTYTAKYEKLSASGSGAGGATSCPTCGG